MPTVKLPNPNIVTWLVLVVLIIFFFVLRSSGQINVDNKKILIIGSVYQTDSVGIAGWIYKGDSAKATKQFKETAAWIAKYGTPILITDKLRKTDYLPKQWIEVFKQWIALSTTCQEYYSIPGKKDGMQEQMELHYTMKIPIPKNEKEDWQTAKLMIDQIPDMRTLLTELDTMKTVYYNTLCYRTAIKNNCPKRFIGTSMRYTVPAGKYCSTVSQVAAQNAAQMEAETNKQSYANLYGSCIRKR